LYVYLHLTLINGDGWWPTCCLLCTAFDLLLDPANEAHVAHHWSGNMEKDAQSQVRSLSAHCVACYKGKVLINLVTVSK